MRPTLFFIVGLSYAASTGAVPTCDMSWRTDRHYTNPGIVLTAGIDGFKPNEPAPSELLEKIGPLLCAAGTEELRVHHVSRLDRKAERIIKLRQFIRGREVMLGWVNVNLNIRTNEVVTINANFLPDRGLEQEPRLTAGLAKAKARPGLQQGMNELLGSMERKFRFGSGPDPKLFYEIEEAGFAPIRGVLAWELTVIDQDNQRYRVHVDAASGRIMRAWGYVEGD